MAVRLAETTGCDTGTEKPFWLICITHLLLEVYMLVQVALIPVYVREFQLSLLEASLVATIPSFAQLLMNIPFGFLMHRFAVKRPHCFISNSMGGKDFLVRNYGFRPEAIQMIRNGIPARNPVAGRTAWRKQLGLAPDSFVSCMVANLSRHKDHVTLLKAWREVLDRSGDSRAVLLLAGRFDGTEKVLHQLCEELGIPDQVRFLGKVDDVDGLLDAVDLFVYSSRSEGIPNAVLEAMAAGLPVVATDIPGIREAAGPEGSGFLALVGDHRVFADRILLFLHDDLLRRTSGAQLKARVESEFSIDRMCEETATLLCSALRKTEEM